MLALLIVFASIFLAVPSALAQDATPPPQYQQTVKAAVEEFASGNWQEARAQFGKAHSLMPNARTLRGLGMVAFELREYIDALGYLSAAMGDSRRPLTDQQKAQTQDLIDRSRSYVGQYQITLSPANATVSVDRVATDVASRPLFLEMGNHQLVVRAAGHEDLVHPIKVQGGENEAITLTLNPTPAAPVVAAAPVQPLPAPTPAPVKETTQKKKQGGSGPSAWAWITGGAAIAVGGAGLAFKFVGDGLYSELEEGPGGCAPFCDEDDTAPVEAADTMMGTFFIAAGVLAATSVVLFIVTSGGEESPTSAKLEAAPGAVRLTGSF